MARSKKTTMAKLNREAKLAEKRMAKERRKEARKDEPGGPEIAEVEPVDQEELEADIARVMAALEGQTAI